MTTELDRARAGMLESLDRRIEARLREFRERGEFADVHAADFRDEDEKQVRIGQRMHSALQQGKTLQILGIEVQRDFIAMYEELKKLMYVLDAASMKAMK
ncbi:hypothetical protein FHP25_20815 [Vineibacter terrae]|uniref:Uncharacterized protein n=1 Tax=Vineibacter terrae TaxID=2586908 RepID=A0A5C8PK34_9HYPH|nr:hypothetical protein [Vineibacter terrae]TXL73620.1 hypothetical protein FHP25_20815 [Vineibacter terrae]